MPKGCLKWCSGRSDRTRKKDVIYLHAKEADRYHKANRSTGYSPASFYRAIDELISKGIIARSTLPHMFWINPAIFWNGDRLRFITEYDTRNLAT